MSDCGFVMSESPSGLGEAVAKAIEFLLLEKVDKIVLM